MHYELSPRDGRHLLRGLQSLAKVQQAAGAVAFIFPFWDTVAPYKAKPNEDFSWILSKKFSPSRIALFSAHPHGSIQAASKPQEGAISPDFELYGHKNIFVMDASWYPTGLSVNPQIATMSSVLRAARKLSAQKRDRL